MIRALIGILIDGIGSIAVGLAIIAGFFAVIGLFLLAFTVHIWAIVTLVLLVALVIGKGVLD